MKPIDGESSTYIDFEVVINYKVVDHLRISNIKTFFT